MSSGNKERSASPDDDETVSHPGNDASTLSLPWAARPAADEAEIGAVTDRYRLGTKLGEGGMAVVVEAEDLRLDRTVAVKCIRPNLALDPDARRRFIREAKILAALSHPGTVAVHDIGGEETAPFYAMERVGGRTLRELLNARTADDVRSRQSLLHFIDIFEQVCRTVAYAHARGVIHRDLKPGNVMVDDDYGTVLVMDWGLAKVVGRDADSSTPSTRDVSPAAAPDGGEGLTLAGAVMGTPGYMSPEQAQGADAVRPESDVFALGVILYEILSGQRPFAGKSPLDVKNEVLFHEPPAPLTLNARAGREPSAICMKALHKDPARRYLSARELAADLRRFREFRPVSVVEPRLVERVVLWARRHSVLAAALGTLLAAVVVAAGFAGVQRYVEHRVVRRVLATVEEGYAEVQSLEREVSAAREELTGLPAGSTAHAAAVEEERDSRARLATAHLQLRGRLAAVIGFTLGSPHSRAVELGRWQSLRLVELMLELDNAPMARALARSTLEQVERNNVLRLTAADVARLREVAGSGSLD